MRNRERLQRPYNEARSPDVEKSQKRFERSDERKFYNYGPSRNQEQPDYKRDQRDPLPQREQLPMRQSGLNNSMRVPMRPLGFLGRPLPMRRIYDNENDAPNQRPFVDRFQRSGDAQETRAFPGRGIPEGRRPFPTQPGNPIARDQRDFQERLPQRRFEGARPPMRSGLAMRA